MKPQHHLFRLRTSNQHLADGEYVSLDMVMEKSRHYMNGTMSQEKYFSFLQAVENYRTYIDLLPEGSDTVFFTYDRFKDGVFQ